MKCTNQANTLANFVRMIRFLLFAALAAMLSNCGNHTTTGNLKVFRYNQSSGISSLDPAFAKDQATIWACNQLYNSLVALDSNLNIVPSIAHSWQIAEDGLTYTFLLRNDVFFHNNICFNNGTGRKVTAHDVAFSLSRIMDKKTASPGAWIFNEKVAAENPFTALNDSTFQLKLSKKFPAILGILSMQYCSIIPHEAVEKYGTNVRSNPVGTGPFMFKKWEEGNALVMLKNPTYFEKDKQGIQLPYIDGIKVSFIDNKKTEFLAFKQKQIDFISGIDAAYIDEVLEKNGTLKKSWEGKMILQKSAYLNTEYLGFFTQKSNELSPFLNKDLRKAINYGIHRKEIIQYLRNGVGKPALQGFSPLGLPSFANDLKGYDFDIEKAKSHLKKSGYQGEELKLFSNETYKDMAILISKQLESIGIKVKVEMAQPSILREWMSQGKVHWFRGSWLADYPDAENYFAVFYSKNGAPPNYTRFSNKTFDYLYESSFSITNEQERFEIYRKLDSIIIEEAPVVPLYYDEVLRFIQPGISGISPNAQNLLDLRTVKM
jgi:peptide/nickel transport system substrate-binding protein